MLWVPPIPGDPDPRERERRYRAGSSHRRGLRALLHQGGKGRQLHTTPCRGGAGRGQNSFFSEEPQAGRGLCGLCGLTRHPGVSVLARPPGEVDCDPLKAKGPVFYTDQTGILDTWYLGLLSQSLLSTGQFPLLLYFLPSLLSPPPEGFGGYRNQELEGGLLGG